MSAGQPAAAAPQVAADDAVRAALRTQWDGVRALRLDSPPGAGKTGVVERLAVQSMAMMGERCMVVTQTNEQAFDVARRLSTGFSHQPFALFVRQNLVLPGNLIRPNLQIARSPAMLPGGPCVVISNAVKWSWVDETVPPFDCQIVDEAFQLPDYRFQQIAGLARRAVLVGDPGQIAPVITAEIERWKSDPTGPHVPCPEALAARHPGILRMTLPVSRRLVPDTVRVVQPAFYPRLPFVALSAPDERGLSFRNLAESRLDAPLDLLGQGASLVQVQLPPLITGEVDEELADTIVSLVVRLFERRTVIRDDGTQEDIRPDKVGVVCAHVAQVNAVYERLPARLTGIFVETADRFQGLERPITLVHHPLSGRADASEFHLDVGRLCVMLSRHRVACIVVTRAGIDEMLTRYAPSGDRVLGIDRDTEYEGWRAHRTILHELGRLGRVVRI